MLGIDMEFKKGILFVRLSGILNGDTASLLDKEMTSLIETNGIRYVVLNSNNLRAIDVDSINDIIEYNKKILKDQRRLLICDANNSRKRIFSNNIQKINCEIDAFSLI